MKAVIPVAGAGTRLRPLTYTQPKPLIPVAGKPIIAFIVDELVDAGIRDFVFVIGYLGDKIKKYLESHYPRLKKTFILQENREGLGHAIWMAGDIIRNEDPLFIVLGDLIFDLDLKEMIQCEHSCLAISKVSDPREFGVVELNRDSRVVAAVEKPSIPKSNLALIGIYKFKNGNQLFDALDFIIKNEQRTHGEFQLTDAIMRMIEKGNEFNVINIESWYDCGKKEVLLETNGILLEKAGYATLNLPKFSNTIIIQPVNIGEGCIISNSIIGPHVTIGPKTTINSAIVKESIIGEHASLEEVVLHHSIVGNDASIVGVKQSLNIGDNTEIDFGGTPT